MHTSNDRSFTPHRSEIFKGVSRHSLTKDVEMKLKTLENYDLGRFIETKSLGRELESEVKRFFALRLLEPRLQDFPIVPPLIDKVWHAMVLDTRWYAEFCVRTQDQFIHHGPKEVRPLTSQEKVAVEWFHERYRHWFGEEPSKNLSTPPRIDDIDYGSECA